MLTYVSFILILIGGQVIFIVWWHKNNYISDDFKPASVDEHKAASLDVGSNQQVTVTVPNLDGSGTMQTVFKGSHRPYQRECVLIIDKTTGEITLEKLANNIQLKKTR